MPIDKALNILEDKKGVWVKAKELQKKAEYPGSMSELGKELHQKGFTKENKKYRRHGEFGVQYRSI